MSSRKRPAIVEVDVAHVYDVLERARSVLPAEDYTCLEDFVESYVELTRLVRERGTTIARLRHLFGLRPSEKTADVLESTSAAPPPQSDTSAPPATDADVDRSSTSAGTGVSGAEPGNADAGNASTPPPPSRPGHGRRGAEQYSAAQRVVVTHQNLHAGDVCPDCACGKVHGLKVPARLVRVVGQAALAARVWECERLRCGACGNVFTARAPDEAYGPKYDVTAVAMMALLRYGTGMPLHRLGRLQENLQTPVPASTQWEVVRDHADGIAPAYQELRRLGAQGHVLHNDDTSVRILSLLGKRRARLIAAGTLPDAERTGLYTTGIVSLTHAGPIVLFSSGRRHAGENLDELLARREPELPAPIHMCDGLERNAPANHVVVASNCLAHGRRHVVDEVENFPPECRHVLEKLAEVFENEAACKKQKLSPDERLAFHQCESAPVLAELETWMNAELDEGRIEPNSGLGQAFRYLLKRWDKLTLFLRVPGAPLDNNICERALKMAIRHRNNSLFYRSERGAEVADMYMSLIYTAELHAENPFAYLVALLERTDEVAKTPGDWLPWTFRDTLARTAAAAA
jgi:transposase